MEKLTNISLETENSNSYTSYDNNCISQLTIDSTNYPYYIKDSLARYNIDELKFYINDSLISTVNQLIENTQYILNNGNTKIISDLEINNSNNGIIYLGDKEGNRIQYDNGNNIFSIIIDESSNFQLSSNNNIYFSKSIDNNGIIKNEIKNIDSIESSGLTTSTITGNGDLTVNSNSLFFYTDDFTFDTNGLAIKNNLIIDNNSKDLTINNINDFTMNSNILSINDNEIEINNDMIINGNITSTSIITTSTAFVAKANDNNNEGGELRLNTTDNSDFWACDVDSSNNFRIYDSNYGQNYVNLILKQNDNIHLYSGNGSEAIYTYYPIQYAIAEIYELGPDMPTGLLSSQYVVLSAYVGGVPVLPFVSSDNNCWYLKNMNGNWSAGNACNYWYIQLY